MRKREYSKGYLYTSVHVSDDFVCVPVALQHIDKRDTLLSALKELREAIVFDFHPEAFFQKYSIVQVTVIPFL